MQGRNWLKISRGCRLPTR